MHISKKEIDVLKDLDDSKFINGIFKFFFHDAYWRANFPADGDKTEQNIRLRGSKEYKMIKCKYFRDFFYNYEKLTHTKLWNIIFIWLSGLYMLRTDEGPHSSNTGVANKSKKSFEYHINRKIENKFAYMANKGKKKKIEIEKNDNGDGHEEKSAAEADATISDHQ